MVTANPTRRALHLTPPAILKSGKEKFVPNYRKRRLPKRRLLAFKEEHCNFQASTRITARLKPTIPSITRRSPAKTNPPPKKHPEANSQPQFHPRLAAQLRNKAILQIRRPDLTHPAARQNEANFDPPSVPAQLEARPSSNSQPQSHPQHTALLRNKASRQIRAPTAPAFHPRNETKPIFTPNRPAPKYNRYSSAPPRPRHE
jgi:hypothetical protein